MNFILAVALLGQASAPNPVSTLPVVVRPTDLDVKGHAGNARHLEYLQWGRWRWLEDRGLSDESLRAAGAVLVVVRVEIDYRAEIRYGDTVRVVTSAFRDGEKKVAFGQRIMRPDGILAAEAKVLMVAIDPATRRSRPVPDSLAKALAPPAPLPGQPPNLSLPGARPVIIERHTYDWPPPDVRIPKLDPISWVDMRRAAQTAWLIRQYTPARRP